MRGDQQERVQQPPPVRLAEFPAHRLREPGQRDHELGGQLVGVPVEGRGHGRNRLPEPAGAAEPDGLGVGFLLGVPLLRALLDRVQPRSLLTVTLTATAAGQFGLFTSISLATALPAAVAIGAFGSMSEVIPQTAMQRVIPNAVLGRISAVFLTGEAVVGLLGAVAGPFLAQAAHLAGLAAVASLVTLAAAVLTRRTVPPMPPGTRP